MELFLVAKGSVFVVEEELLDTVIETSANGSDRAAVVGLWIALGACRRERFFSGIDVSPNSPEPVGAYDDGRLYAGRLVLFCLLRSLSSSAENPLKSNREVALELPARDTGRDGAGVPGAVPGADSVRRKAAGGGRGPTLLESCRHIGLSVMNDRRCVCPSVVSPRSSRVDLIAAAA